MGVDAVPARGEVHHEPSVGSHRLAIDRDVNGARNIGLRYLTQQLQGRTAPPQ